MLFALLQRADLIVKLLPTASDTSSDTCREYAVRLLARCSQNTQICTKTVKYSIFRKCSDRDLSRYADEYVLPLMRDRMGEPKRIIEPIEEVVHH